jgi:hypothetical protein
MTVKVKNADKTSGKVLIVRNFEDLVSKGIFLAHLSTNFRQRCKPLLAQKIFFKTSSIHFETSHRPS